MFGRGYKKQEIESDGDIDSNNDSEDNDGDEDYDGYDCQPDDSDDQSEGGDDQFDESGDDDDDDNDDDRDVIKYMRGFGDIKFDGDKIYEQVDSKLNLDDKHIEIGGDVYKLRGNVFTCRGQKLYMINGMLFQECEDMGTDEIMNWDGKCFKRFKLGWEKKLEGDKKELEDNLELANCKVCELILTHIKSLKGNFSEYIEHASDHDIDQIQYCCFVLMYGRCPCKGRGNEILAKMVRKDMKKIIDPDVSRDEKRKILSHQQKGSGIFSLLLGTVLPALISAFVK